MIYVALVYTALWDNVNGKYLIYHVCKHIVQLFYSICHFICDFMQLSFIWFLIWLCVQTAFFECVYYKLCSSDWMIKDVSGWGEHCQNESFKMHMFFIFVNVLIFRVNNSGQILHLAAAFVCWYVMYAYVTPVCTSLFPKYLRLDLVLKATECKSHSVIMIIGNKPHWNN